jgi:hypothetical protein
MDLFGSRQVSVVGSCSGHGNEIMGSIKFRTFFDHLNKCYVLRDYLLSCQSFLSLTICKIYRYIKIWAWKNKAVKVAIFRTEVLLNVIIC